MSGSKKRKSSKPASPHYSEGIGVGLPEHNRVVGYVRVSTDDQNLEMQIRALIKAGVKPDDIYSDKLSGGTLKRSGLRDALNDCRSGDILVVWKLDRLARSLKDLIDLFEALEADGIELRSLHEQIDTTTPIGKFMFHLTGALAEFEKSLISFRTSEGMKVAREKGQKFGPAPKFGAKEVKQAIKMLKSGKTVPDVAQHFSVSRQLIYPKVLAATGGKKLWEPKVKARKGRKR